MSFKFLKQPLAKGLYEPEGIYLAPPLEGSCLIIQTWGDNHEFYRAYTYNHVPLKGHNGIDLLAQPGAAVCAVDHGRVMGIGNESPGWGRHVKIEHSWGESFYAHMGTILVEAGQLVTQSQKLATIEPVLRQSVSGKTPSYLHFGIRIKPYNRFDGWGGFVDPVPFLDPEHLSFSTTGESSFDQNSSSGTYSFPPHPMLTEHSQQHRP